MNSREKPKIQSNLFPLHKDSYQPAQQEGGLLWKRDLTHPKAKQFI